MWAGGEVEFVKPLRIGDKVRRTTVISDIQHKNGRTGELWFVTVEHDYQTQRGSLIRERQDIVYRAPVEAQDPASARPAAKPEVEELPLVWSVDTPPTLLFRYSAIIFIAHRIHYDLPYARDVEGYEGLVVHGPLQATLLLNAVSTRIDGVPERFRYRGTAPAIGGRRLDVCVDDTGDPRFHTRSNGAICMAGQASGRAASG